MSSLLIILLLLIGASLQTLLAAPVVLGLAGGPILLGLTLCIALRIDRPRALLTGLLAGVLHDAFCPAPLGVSIPFFLLIALGVHALREEVFGDQIITYAVLGLLGALSKTLYFTLVLSVAGLRPFGIAPLAVHLLGNGLLGLVATPLIFLLISRLPSGRVFRQRRWIA